MLRRHRNGSYHRPLEVFGTPSTRSCQSVALYLSLAANVILLSFVVANRRSSLEATTVAWHGGHPSATQTGSCFCGSFDKYCLCTPNLAIDVVIHTSGDDIWLVRRKDTSELATMGGFVDVGETVESAVERELQEEMGINASSQASRIRLLGIYSDPQRDNRRHTVSAVFSIRLDGSERPKAADDVKQVKRISLATVESHKYFADHRAILLDYRTWWYSLSKEDQIGAYHAREGSLQHPPEQGATHFPSRVVRSLC